MLDKFTKKNVVSYLILYLFEIFKVELEKAFGHF